MTNASFERLIAFRLPGDLVAKLDNLAAGTDRSRSAVLRELLRRAEATGRADLALTPAQSRSGNS